MGPIVDKIISEIRRARFVVVDYTHGTQEGEDGKGAEEKGARGSVYYEAGYAHGRGLKPLFLLARKRS